MKTTTKEDEEKAYRAEWPPFMNHCTHCMVMDILKVINPLGLGIEPVVRSSQGYAFEEPARKMVGRAVLQKTSFWVKVFARLESGIPMHSI